MPTVEVTHRISVEVAQVWSSPDAPRPIDAPMLEASPQVARWLAALDTGARLDLLGRVETQALFGEPVIVVAEEGDWCEVRLPEQPTSREAAGYPGWVKRDHLRADDSTASRCHITSRWALLYPETNGLADGAIGMGASVDILDDSVVADSVGADSIGSDSVRIQTTRGPRFIDRRAITPRHTPIVIAADMLGLAYLWSGLSSWGVDCSGLVHLSNRVAGITVPRDSVDQFDARIADTVYFRHRSDVQHENSTGRIHHVGYELGAGLMLHAPKTGRVVELMPLDTPPYDREICRFGT